MSPVSSQYAFRFCAFEFRPSTRRLRSLRDNNNVTDSEDKGIKLGKIQSDMLELLLTSKRGSVTTDQICAALWPSQRRPDVRTIGKITNVIHELKTKLGKECAERFTTAKDGVTFRLCDELGRYNPPASDQLEPVSSSLLKMTRSYIEERGLGTASEVLSQQELMKLLQDQVWTTVDNALPIVVDQVLQLLWGRVKSSIFPERKQPNRAMVALFDFAASQVPTEEISELVRDAVRQALREARRQNVGKEVH